MITSSYMPQPIAGAPKGLLTEGHTPNTDRPHGCLTRLIERFRHSRAGQLATVASQAGYSLSPSKSKATPSPIDTKASQSEEIEQGIPLRRPAGAWASLAKRLLPVVTLAACVTGADGQTSKPKLQFITMGPQGDDAISQWQSVFAQKIESSGYKGSIIHHIHSDDWMYARNVMGVADGVMLIGRPVKGPPEPNLHDIQVRLSRSTKTVKKELEQWGIPVKMLPFGVNFANIIFDQEKSLLIMAFDFVDYSDCAQKLHPHIGCPDQADAIVKAYGAQHVVKYEVDTTQRTSNSIMPCYDQDANFLYTQNARGDRVALIYSKCIESKPTDPALMARKEVGASLKRHGIDVIALNEKDVENSVPNSLTLEPGVILSPGPVSKKLSKQLAKKEIQVIDSPNKEGVFPHSGANPAGYHCLTVEVPKQLVQSGWGRHSSKVNKDKEL